MDERKFIIDSFRKNFTRYSNDNIVIYGLGKNTKAVLDECKEFSIVGLMDGVRTGEFVWGLPVITCEQAKQKNTKIIVIIATSANVPVIYRRISEQCRKMNIKVFDINGDEQRLPGADYKIPDKIKRIKKEVLIEKIDTCDVVSFDIFDTLLVRNTMQPTDVFEIMQIKYSSILPRNFPFAVSRINAERDLYLTTNPTLNEIYDSLVNNYGLPEDIANQMMQNEINEEISNLHPRSSMVRILEYAKLKGKKVCCTSDMYISGRTMKDILSHNGITGLDNIFISCDYKKSKCNGLYNVVRECYPNMKILHIGDNREADIISAFRYGIDDTFEICSIYQMALYSRFSYILDLAHSLYERNVLGEFLSHQLNDPFLFEMTDGRLNITDCYSLGYFYLEPIIEAFLYWMIESVENDNIDYLLLGSRDGWLIKELLDILGDKRKFNFKYSYFYVSRSACTIAGMSSIDDIKYAAYLAFDGSIEQMLEKRFFLNKKEVYERYENETDEKFLERHYEIILEKVKEHRNNYLKYISSCGIENKKLGFFDFVSSGTCQLWIEKIIGTEVYGYYFARNIDKYKEHLKIKSLFKPICIYEKQSKLYNDYIFLESILTSPEATIKYFDSEGNCVYDTDNRSEEEIQKLLEIHDGIKKAFKKRMDKGEAINSKLAESLMDLVIPEYSVIDVDFFKTSILSDEFCNRTFDLQQVLNA